MDTLEQVPQPIEVRLTNIFKGVALPTWLAVVFGAAAFLGALTLAVVLLMVQSALQESAAADRDLAKEIRILQVHAQDIENVLIRHGLAQRGDFAPWPGDRGSIDIKPHDKEK